MCREHDISNFISKKDANFLIIKINKKLSDNESLNNLDFESFSVFLINLANICFGKKSVIVSHLPAGYLLEYLFKAMAEGARRRG